MSVFVHAQGIKTVHAGGGEVKKWQNSVHVVVECPLCTIILHAGRRASKVHIFWEGHLNVTFLTTIKNINCLSNHLKFHHFIINVCGLCFTCPNSRSLKYLCLSYLCTSCRKNSRYHMFMVVKIHIKIPFYFRKQSW